MLRAFSSLFVIVACAAACRAPHQGLEPSVPRPRGVIVFLADDVGVEAFGSYGGTSYSTPRLDRLAAEGLRFTAMHAQPLCTPSRVKLLTGKSNLRNYQRFSVLDPDEPTIADVLRDAGYATAAVGKWQLRGAAHYRDWAGIGARPEEAGFDRWCLWQVEELGSRYWQPLLEVDGLLHEGAEDDYGPRAFLEYAKRFVEEHADEPFFLFYPLALVHDPFVRTPDSAPDTEGAQAFFADMMAEMDHVVGELADHVDRLGIAEDTLLLFTSDNGTHRRIRSMRDGREIRGGKRETNDRGTHVPLIARWPGTIAAGRTSDDLMDLSDLFPTIARVCDAALPTGHTFDGHDFTARLLGRPHAPRRWISIYSNPRPGQENFPPSLFVRDARYKLYDDGRAFDLARDPDEEEPLDLDLLESDGRAAIEALRVALTSLPAPHAELGGEALRARRRSGGGGETR